MTQRRRAYEQVPVWFRLNDLPKQIESGGTFIPHPARQAAVFVVHGIGLQEREETAVTLRSGFEDALDEVCSDGTRPSVPPPYMREGYWGDYAEFKESFQDEWLKASEKDEQPFYGRLWKRRAVGALRSGVWFVRQNLKLISLATFQNDDVRILRGITLVAMVPLTLASVALLLFRGPRLLAEVLGDVRIYCDPQGEVEDAIVQRVDRRVGEEFLRLLGLDWSFKDLDHKDLVTIFGMQHRFTYVTWVAHSLGTVISYNVIGDIFERAQQLRDGLEKRKKERRPGELESDEDRELRQNIERVEMGLHRFVTIGSPLERIALLSSETLRQWPAAAKDHFRADANPRRWINFFHVWDPVSSRLLTARFKGLVTNLHSRLWRLPLVAHTSYWADRPILKYVVSRTYGNQLCPWPDPKFRSERAVSVARKLTSWVTLGAIGGILYLGWRWLVAWSLSDLWTIAKDALAGL